MVPLGVLTIWRPQEIGYQESNYTVDKRLDRIHTEVGVQICAYLHCFSFKLSVKPKPVSDSGFAVRVQGVVCEP